LAIVIIRILWAMSRRSLALHSYECYFRKWKEVCQGRRNGRMEIMDEEDTTRTETSEEGEQREFEELQQFGNEPGKPMYDYFLDKHKLPEGLTMEMYQEGLSCMGYAKLILGEVGGAEKARVYWMKNEEDETGHALVVPNEFDDNQVALNNNPIAPNYETVTAGKARQGEDITDEVVGETWDRL